MPGGGCARGRRGPIRKTEAVKDDLDLIKGRPGVTEDLVRCSRRTKQRHGARDAKQSLARAGSDLPLSCGRAMDPNARASTAEETAS